MNTKNHSILDAPPYKRGLEVGDAIFYRDRLRAPDTLEYHEVLALISYILYGTRSEQVEKLKGGRNVSVQ